jgi:hypothetical protein
MPDKICFFPPFQALVEVAVEKMGFETSHEYLGMLRQTLSYPAGRASHGTDYKKIRQHLNSSSVRIELTSFNVVFQLLHSMARRPCFLFGRVSEILK